MKRAVLWLVLLTGMTATAQAPKPAPTPAPAPVPAPTPTPDPVPTPPPGVVDRAKAVLTTLNNPGEVPATWPLGFPVGLSSSASHAGDGPDSTKWIIDPAFLDQYAYRINNGRDLIVGTGTRPITITVTLVVGKADTVDVVRKTIQVIGDDPNPDPGPTPVPPGPGPIPPPNPNPPVPVVTGHLHVTLVFDPAVPSLAIGKIRGTQTLAADLKALDATWYAVDSKSLLAAQPSFKPTLDSVGGSPALVIQDSAGKIVAKAKLDEQAKPEDVTAMVRKLRGKP